MCRCRCFAQRLDAARADRPESARSARALRRLDRTAQRARRRDARRAVGVGGNVLQKSSRRWYFSCVRSMALRSAPLRRALARRTCRCALRAAPARRALCRRCSRSPAFRRCASIIASCSVEGFARCTRSSASSRRTSVTSFSRSARLREQLRQRRERALGLVAHDDLLLAANRRHWSRGIAGSRLL